MGRHTEALTYRWWERLHFFVFGHWPQSVVSRRLDASYRDTVELRHELHR